MQIGKDKPCLKERTTYMSRAGKGWEHKGKDMIIILVYKGKKKKGRKIQIILITDCSMVMLRTGLASTWPQMLSPQRGWAKNNRAASLFQGILLCSTPACSALEPLRSEFAEPCVIIVSAVLCLHALCLWCQTFSSSQALLLKRPAEAASCSS